MGPNWNKEEQIRSSKGLRKNMGQQSYSYFWSLQNPFNDYMLLKSVGKGWTQILGYLDTCLLHGIQFLIWVAWLFFVFFCCCYSFCFFLQTANSSAVIYRNVTYRKAPLQLGPPSGHIR